MTDETFIARLRLLRAGTLAVAAILALRLLDLQVLRSGRYARAAEGNAIQTRPIRAPRGLILDRRGVVLADERPAFDIEYVAAGTPRGHEEATAGRLAAILGETRQAGSLLEKIRGARRAPLRPVTLARDVGTAAVERVAWDGPFLPGVLIRPARARRYPLGSLMAHVVGYLSEAGPDDVGETYALGDLLGVSGVEALEEDVLRGEDGYEAIEVDALGQPRRVLLRKPPRPGRDVTLTVDAELAAWAAESIAGRPGAFAAVDPRTGDILALVSSPAFDPGAFADRRRAAERAAYLADDSHPMLHRAVGSGYAPGSTFKAVVLAAGLRTGSLRPSTRFHCSGWYAGRKCWKTTGHGTLDLQGGFANSCNVYYYHAGEVVGIEALAATARDLGIGRPPGLGLGGREEAGIAPDPAWKAARLPAPLGAWTLGDLHNTAIGQGFVLASPLQVARAFGAVALGGRLAAPRLVLRAGDEAPGDPPVAWETEAFLSDTAVGIVRAAMRAVVEGGTGSRLRMEGVPIGGKSGTAENPHGRDHAWMVAAVPMPEPRVVFAVLLENAGFGSAAAGPVARHVLERLAVREGWTVR